jgi:two-component system chemotaxis response regulator CheY
LCPKFYIACFQEDSKKLIRRRRRMKCLIIDDDEFNRNFVITLIADFAECHEASDGTEAIEKFEAALESKAPYDLIFQDIMMPGMNGHETARAIRNQERVHGIKPGKGVHIVMITALNSPQDAMESFCSAQSAAYLIKPVSKEKVLGIISKLGLLRRKPASA